MKTKICEGLAFAAMLMLSSCATIFNGGAPLVTIEGDVDEPVTITTKKGVYQDVTLPVEVKVSQRHIEGQHSRYNPTTTNSTISCCRRSRLGGHWRTSLHCRTSADSS